MDDLDPDQTYSVAPGESPAELLVYELTTDNDGAPLLRLDGELDMNNADRLDAAVAEVISEKPERLVVDAKNLSFADSSAIALLVRWSTRVSHVEIREPPELLRRVITRMGLSEQLQVRP